MTPRLKIPLIILALAASGALIYFTGRVVLVVFMAIVLAVGLDALADLVHRGTRLPRGGSLLLVVILLAGGTVGTFVLVGPKVSDQFARMSEKVPEAIDEIESWLQDRGWGKLLMSQVPTLKEMGESDESSSDETADETTPTTTAGESTLQRQRRLLFSPQPQRRQDQFTGTDLLSKLTGVFSVTLSTLVNIAVLVVVGLYLAGEPRLYRAGMLWLVPERHDAIADRLLRRWARALRWWLLGRIISMAIVGVLTGLGLWLLGLPLAFVLGLIAGLLSFIPNLGPILSAIPGILIGLIQGPWMAVWAAAIYAGVQFVESYLITPLIQERAVSIPPALLLTVQLVMGVLAGVWGLLAATPLMVTVIVATQTLYVRRQLGKPVPIMGGHVDSSSGAHEVTDDDDDDDD